MFPFPCGWWTCTIILFDYFNLSLINSFCIIWFSLLLLINSFNIIWFSLLITHQLLLYYLIIPIIYYASSQFVFIYLFLSLSHISFWMADANAIYHSSLIIYYSSTLFVLFDHHYYYTDHLSLFNFIFSSHISLLMADANAIYHFSLIICYSWTEHIITHQHFFVLFLFFVDAMFISSFFISSYFRSVWHPFSCFILRMVYFFYFVLPLLGLHIFHHVHPTL